MELKVELKKMELMELKYFSGMVMGIAIILNKMT